jgi:hypothetical protein
MLLVCPTCSIFCLQVPRRVPPVFCSPGPGPRFRRRRERQQRLHACLQETHVALSDAGPSLCHHHQHSKVFRVQKLCQVTSRVQRGLFSGTKLAYYARKRIVITLLHSTQLFMCKHSFWRLEVMVFPKVQSMLLFI